MLSYLKRSLLSLPLEENLSCLNYCLLKGKKTPSLPNSLRSTSKKNQTQNKLHNLKAQIILRSKISAGSDLRDILCLHLLSHSRYPSKKLYAQRCSMTQPLIFWILQNFANLNGNSNNSAVNEMSSFLPIDAIAQSKTVLSCPP